MRGGMMQRGKKDNEAISLDSTTTTSGSNDVDDATGVDLSLLLPR
jgi:hypothetical protein